MLDKFRETAITWDKANRKVYEPLRASAGDNKGRKLSVQIVNDGVIEDLSGASLSLFWETKDKSHKGLDAFTAVDATKGEFEIYYTTGMLSNEGALNANLILVDANGRIVSEPFTITVFQGIDDDAIQSEDSFTALTQALVQVGNINYQVANMATKKELQQVSLAYKESYATVALLQAAYPNGDIFNHVVLSNNMIYTYKNGWVSTGVQANGTGLADGTVDIAKTTFIIPSANLYNKEDSRNIDGKFLNFSGSPATQSNNVETEISHPIKVTPGQKYITIFDSSYFGVANARVALYDANGNYIDRSTPVITGRIGTLTIPTLYPQLDHIRFSYRKTDKASLMFVKGDVYPTEYIPFLSKMTEDITLNNRQLSEIDKRLKNISPLYMQRIEAIGNSIMYGAGDSGRGWPYRLAIKYQMTYNNRAIAGAVFARGVKTSSGADVPTILDQIGQVTGNAMYNLVEGGTNDEDYNVPMGSITQGKAGPFDETTYSGALESAFSRLISKCHGKKILYIIPQKMGNATWQARRYTRFVRSMEICKKWGIPYVNLWDECYLDPTVPALQNAYYSDEQHLNSNGYDLTTPIIENKLLKI